MTRSLDNAHMQLNDQCQYPSNKNKREALELFESRLPRFITILAHLVVLQSRTTLGK